MPIDTKNSVQCLLLVLALGPTAVAMAQSNDILDVYDKAIDYDAVLRAELADRNASEEEIEIAAAARKPRLDFEASASVNDSDDASDSSWDASSLALNAVQPLYDRVASQSLDRARVDFEGANANVLDAQQQLVLRVASGYFGVLRAQASLSVSDAELEAIDRQRIQVRRQFDVGLVPDTDVLEADAQFDLAAARRIVVDDELFEAQQSLERIAGQLDAPLQTLTDADPTVWLNDTPEQEWVERALTLNPLIIQSQAQLQSLRVGVDVERAARYPTVDLVASASSHRTDQTGFQDNDLVSLGVALNLSLYGGGRVTAQIAQSDAQATAATERLLEQRRALTQQIKVNYRALRSSVQQVQANERALRSTEASYDSIDAAFQAGARTLVDVLDALQDLFAARFDLVDARFSLITEFLNLEAAAGQLDRDDLVTLNDYLEPAQP